nr:hypothetical protein [Tanacetum cinerariifolium]
SRQTNTPNNSTAVAVEYGRGVAAVVGVEWQRRWVVVRKWWSRWVAVVTWVVVAAAVAGVGIRWWGRRVRGGGLVDRIDRKVRKLFGFAGKSPPEKFSSGGSVVAGDDGRLAGVAGGGGY